MCSPRLVLVCQLKSIKQVFSLPSIHCNLVVQNRLQTCTVHWTYQENKSLQSLCRPLLVGAHLACDHNITVWNKNLQLAGMSASCVHLICSTDSGTVTGSITFVVEIM
jgi:hypothetical protein